MEFVCFIFCHRFFLVSAIHVHWSFLSLRIGILGVIIRVVTLRELALKTHEGSLHASREKIYIIIYYSNDSVLFLLHESRSLLFSRLHATWRSTIGQFIYFFIFKIKRKIKK